jgi:prepilin-type N-terminal cleavage/methylation domain-containing protein
MGGHQHNRHSGFTLIELSIVLVIIGLIVGGILAGQNLIAAAAIRAQVTQVEKYKTSVNAFFEKYGYLPGDIPPTPASQFGFLVGQNCGGAIGARDGNGLIQGGGGTYAVGFGESMLFWQDLSTAGMIDGNYPNGGAGSWGCLDVNQAWSLIPGTLYVGDHMPAAAIGNGHFLYVYSVNAQNWFGLSAVTATTANSLVVSKARLSVAQAYAIDNKIDDGMPTTGNVQAVYLTNNTLTQATNAVSDSSSTCFNSATNAYSMTQNNGAGPNCALSFLMQSGDR